ncbi:unnamed protein product [Bursaphelenchus xylophilus]|uniref:(pine wood nematode) hypothetical protein n=1 Tax=Bursaphelenchus xylophilus TaxID=6326 RepID=A0A1I7S6T2_BURXY|nr:unnamed protein product [Bursaphelenchus xylophilus]CAG9079805.1 unnamed protein product [Bursaphelenchus xylophilus]
MLSHENEQDPVENSASGNQLPNERPTKVLNDGFDLMTDSTSTQSFHAGGMDQCNGFMRPMGGQSARVNPSMMKAGYLASRAKPLPDHLEPARHAGEWRASDSHEKGSYWRLVTAPKPLRGFGIGAMIAPHNATRPVLAMGRQPVRTVWMPVNGLSHSSSLSTLDSDVDDERHFVRRFDDPPCSLPCLQRILNSLPSGRYGICPLHERVIPHPRPPPTIPMGEPRARVRCKPLNAISPIFFHVHRRFDLPKLGFLRDLLDAQEEKIQRYVVHYPVQGGYAVCRHQGQLHRCRINTVGMEMLQVDLIDIGSSAIVPHEELFTMPTDLASFSAPLSFKCSLIEQDTRLLDFKSTSTFKDLIMGTLDIVLEVHGTITPEGKHLVRLIHPAPPEKPKDPFVGRGTRNRKPKMRMQRCDDTDENSEAEDFSNSVAGFRNSDDEFDGTADYRRIEYQPKNDANLWF